MSQLSVIRRSIFAAALGAAWIMSSVATGDASKISSLRVEPHSGSSSYVISKSGTMEVEEFLMQDPPRLVLDLMGAEHELDKTKFEGDGGFVKTVRTSQFTTEPDKITRIVFDLNDNVAYQVTNEAEAITVRFYAKNGEVGADRPTMVGSMAPMESGAPASTEPAKPMWAPVVNNKPESSADVSEPSEMSNPSTTSDQPAQNAKPASPEAMMKAWAAPKDMTNSGQAAPTEQNPSEMPSLWTQAVEQN